MAKATKSEKTETSAAGDLDRTLAQIEKQYGKGIIMHLDENAGSSIAGISTGALSLDLALGGRGVPRLLEMVGEQWTEVAVP